MGNLFREFKEFIKRYAPVWLIPLLILLIILTLMIMFSAEKPHTPFIYSAY